LMVSGIRLGYIRRNLYVDVRRNRMVLDVLMVLLKENYILSYVISGRYMVRIGLRYYNGVPLIREMRVYFKSVVRKRYTVRKLVQNEFFLKKRSGLYIFRNEYGIFHSDEMHVLLRGYGKDFVSFGSILLLGIEI